MLRAGRTLSEATTHLCKVLGIEHALFPMSDDAVPTRVRTQDGGQLAFQHYFVRDRCSPVVTGFDFEGIETARPSPGFVNALGAQRLGAIVVCPSNPFVSVDPVLAIPGVMDAIARASAPLIAVSPIVGGAAIKGPAAKMMKELGMPRTALAVARHYAGRIDGFVLDQVDVGHAKAVEALGMKVLVTNTMMHSLADRTALARDVLAFAEKF
jgi:LPPG:FO 2-phospho-L-lactate transferase